MNKMKPLSMIALIFVLIFSLVACSNINKSTSESSVSPSSSESASQPAVETASAEPTPAPEETYDLGGREIVISHWWDGTPNPETPEGVKALALQTEVEKKYNVKIKYVALDLFQTAEKVSSTVLAGKPFADIVFAAHIYPEALIKGGYVEALDDYMNVKDQTKLSDLIITSGSYGTGKTYGFLRGVPLFDQTGLFYNKRIFQDAGIPTPTELQKEGKWNWDTFVDSAKKLTIDKGGSGKIDQWGLTGSAQELAKHLIHSNNGLIFDEATTKVTLDSPEAMEALEMLNKLFNEYKVVKLDEGNDWEDPARFFREGKVAMYPGGLWEVPNRFQNQMEDEYAFVPFPKGPKASDFIMGQTQMHIYMIPKGVKDPKMVYRIWEDLQDFEHVDESNRTSVESQFTDEESVENALNTFNITKFGRYGAYSIDSIFSPMFKDIATSKVTPAAGVAKILPEMQAAVDKVVNAK
jgi:multiple sugar transport system substrate-binding protein